MATNNEGHVTKWLRPADAAKVLGIGERTLLEIAKAGEIPCRRIGKRFRFHPDDLRAWRGTKYRPYGTKED